MSDSRRRLGVLDVGVLGVGALGVGALGVGALGVGVLGVGALGVRPLLVGIALGILVGLPVVTSAQEEEENPIGKKAEGKQTKGKKKKGTTEVLSADEQYVRDNIEKYLYPTEIKFLDEGRVYMKFDFRKKSDDHADVFTPRVGSKINERFRWSIPDEEDWVDSNGNDIGLRVSNRGMALLNCWFEDDLEAEIYFLQKVNFNNRQYVALVFSNDKQTAIGSNFGTHCAYFKKGRFAGGKGKIQPVVNEQTNKLGLVVKDGKFQALRKGRPRAATKYPKRSFKSGRLGVAWGGNVMGFVSQLTVTGKLDHKKMAAFLKKAIR